MAHLTSPPPSPSSVPPPPSAARPDRGRGGSPVADAISPAAGVSHPETLSPGNPPRIVDSVPQTGDSVSPASPLTNTTAGRIKPPTLTPSPPRPVSSPEPLATSPAPLAPRPGTCPECHEGYPQLRDATRLRVDTPFRPNGRSVSRLAFLPLALLSSARLNPASPPRGTASRRNMLHYGNLRADGTANARPNSCVEYTADPDRRVARRPRPRTGGAGGAVWSARREVAAGGYRDLPTWLHIRLPPRHLHSPESAADAGALGDTRLAALRRPGEHSRRS